MKWFLSMKAAFRTCTPKNNEALTFLSHFAQHQLTMTFTSIYIRFFFFSHLNTEWKIELLRMRGGGGKMEAWSLTCYKGESEGERGGISLLFEKNILCVVKCNTTGKGQLKCE